MNILKSRSINKNSNLSKGLIKTTAGEIGFELFHDSAPITCINFIKNVKVKQYKDVIFHRVIKNFMIQCGEYFFDGTSRKPQFDAIKNESSFSAKNIKGSLAMARNSNINSAKCQFFINTNNNPNLDGKYTVFGRVLSGQSVINLIENLETQKDGWPKNPVKIKQIELSN